MLGVAKNGGGSVLMAVVLRCMLMPINTPFIGSPIKLFRGLPIFLNTGVCPGVVGSEFARSRVYTALPPAACTGSSRPLIVVVW